MVESKVPEVRKEFANVIQYRYDYSSPYLKIFTNNQPSRGRTSATVSFPTELPKAYTKILPISNEKKKDLQQMCNSGIIPNELHSWYLNLPSNATQRNRLPEPSLSEDESE